MPTSRVILLAALALACNPKPAGDDATASSQSTDATDSVGTSSGASDTTGGDPPTSSDTGGASDDGTTGAPTTGVTTGSSTGADTGTTGQPGRCAAITSDEECMAAPDCESVFGSAQQFPGCVAGEQFLACIDEMPCDAVITTVCRDGTDEVYQLTDGCIPPGFTPCDGPGEACEGDPVDCESIVNPVECTLSQCRVVFGAPHIMVDGEVCASYGEDEEFLGCIVVDAPCVDDTIIVCREGETTPSWDSASGCLAPGFATCDAPAVPPCR